jgi:hypothetical protein
MSSTGRLSPPHPSPVSAPLSSLRGRRYGEDRLYLLVRDPHCVLAIWELTPDAHARAEAVARERRAPVRYEIRIERRADERGPAGTEAIEEIPDALGGDRWYVKLPRSGGECRAILGIAVPPGFTPILESSWVPVPPDGPCAEEGAWDLTPEAKSWLLERSRAARGPRHGMSSAARYGTPVPPETPPR